MSSFTHFVLLSGAVGRKRPPADHGGLCDAFGDHGVTRSELRAAVRGAVAGLTRAGIGRGDVVILALSNCVDSALLSLAVVDARAILLCWDTQRLEQPDLEATVTAAAAVSPSGRVHIVVSSDSLAQAEGVSTWSEVHVLVLYARGTPVGVGNGLTRLELGGDSTGDGEASVGSAPASIARGAVLPDIAFITTSSGVSTGASRITTWSHRQLVEQTSILAECGRIVGRDSVVCAVAPFYTFAALVIGVWWPLSVGATVVPVSVNCARDMLSVVHARGVSVCCTLPPQCACLAEVADAEFGSLECVLCGGGPLRHTVRLALRARKVRVVSWYGTSECGVTHMDTGDDVVRGTSRLPPGFCGLPLRGVCARMDPLVTKTGGRRGRVGLICLKAHHIPHTSGFVPSGDIGSVSDSGALTVTGTAAFACVRNGHVVLPSVVERAVARACPVGAVVVLVIGERLFAVVQPLSQERPIRSCDVVTAANAALPPYAQLEGAVITSRLPATVSGRVRMHDVRSAVLRAIESECSGDGVMCSGSSVTSAPAIPTDEVDGRLNDDDEVHVSVASVSPVSAVPPVGGRGARADPQHAAVAPPIPPLPPVLHASEVEHLKLLLLAAERRGADLEREVSDAVSRGSAADAEVTRLRDATSRYSKAVTRLSREKAELERAAASAASERKELRDKVDHLVAALQSSKAALRVQMELVQRLRAEAAAGRRT